MIVFVLTTVTGGVLRAFQKGRKLRGLSRVQWPEMRRNRLAVGARKAGGLARNKSGDDHPTRDARLATRVRLSQLMRAEDFDVLAKYYSDLELLEAAVNRNDHIELIGTLTRLKSTNDRQVIEGYCVARWRPFKGHCPGPKSEGGWGGSLVSLKPSVASSDDTDPKGEG